MKRIVTSLFFVILSSSAFAGRHAEELRAYVASSNQFADLMTSPASCDTTIFLTQDGFYKENINYKKTVSELANIPRNYLTDLQRKSDRCSDSLVMAGLLINRVEIAFLETRAGGDDICTASYPGNGSIKISCSAEKWQQRCQRVMAEAVAAYRPYIQSVANSCKNR